MPPELRLGLDIGGVVSRKLGRRRGDTPYEDFMDPGFVEFFQRFRNDYGVRNLFVCPSITWNQVHVMANAATEEEFPGVESYQSLPRHELDARRHMCVGSSKRQASNAKRGGNTCTSKLVHLPDLPTCIPSYSPTFLPTILTTCLRKYIACVTVYVMALRPYFHTTYCPPTPTRPLAFYIRTT